jgi:hypothetical protein
VLRSRLADGDIAQLILGLAHPDAVERGRAARALFDRGSKLAQSSLESWLAYARLAEWLALGPSGKPELTVGVAVQPETFERVRKANGSPRLADVPPDQDAREFELDFPEAVRLDILTTHLPGRGGAIDRYLQKFGEGIQQVEVAVADVDRATDLLRDKFSIAPIYPATRPGADGTRVNFFLVPTGDGGKVLIEFVEKR